MRHINRPDRLASSSQTVANSQTAARCQSGASPQSAANPQAAASSQTAASPKAAASSLPPRLLSALTAFCSVTDLCVTQYGPDCRPLLELNGESKICSSLPYYNREGTPCRKNIGLAVNLVASLKEPYYYVCPASFILIAVPYVADSVCAGCFIAGPLNMNQPEGSVLTRILSLNFPEGAQATDEVWSRAADVFSALQKVPAFSTKKVYALATLLYQCICLPPDYEPVPVPADMPAGTGSCAHSTSPDGAGLSSDVLLSREKHLLEQIVSGNLDQTRNSMTAYLNQLLLLHGGAIEPCKNHLTGLCALAARSGDPEADMMESFHFIHSLNQVSQISELKQWAQTFIQHFTSRHLSRIYSGDSVIVAQLINLILSDEFFSLTLADAAEQLHVNPSWLSTHFKKEIGVSFTDFVTERKIQKARELLASTDLRIIEIAMRCGFEEQSYFTKIFRRVTGMTPKQYRNRRI